MSPGKRGRPPLKEERRKGLEFHIRVTPEEKEIIQSLADAQNQSVSRYLVSLAIRENERSKESFDRP